MSSFETELRKLLGEAYFAHLDESFDEEYQGRFSDDGGKKVKPFLDELVETASSYAYLSIGGADGSEVAYVLEETDIKNGFLLEYSTSGCKRARERAQSLEKKGKSLEVFEGDASQKLDEVLKALHKLRKNGQITGLACSFQSILHELPSRSVNHDGQFDMGLYLAEVFRDWDNLLFISREPCECSAEDWPETVQIRIRDENEGFLHENTLYEVASYVNAHLSLGGKPAKAANGYVQMSRKLAVECLFKLLYFDGAQGLHYEMGEQLTSLDPPVLRDVLNHCLGNGSAEFTRTNSERFKTLYDARVDAATRSGQKLPRPQVFAIYRARRNGNLPGK